MFEERDSNLDDLIGGNQRPIIVEREGSDKKFLYTLLILLVVLFLVALGLIAFLGSKYFGGNTNRVPVQQQVQNGSNKTTTGKSIEKVMGSTYEKPKVVNTQIANTQASKKRDNSAVNELEQLVKTQEKAKPKTVVEKSITKVAKGSGKGRLSQEELATIAKLVAKELAKSKTVTKSVAQTPQARQVQNTAPQSDAALVASLQQADTDTLKESNVNTNSIKSSNVKASSSKKVDTFNKVVVQQKANKNDDLAKLSSEIDTILQTEDVQKHKKNLKYKKVLDKEANVRAGELRFIVVKKGDTLSSIAYRAYGRASAYTKIYRANPDLVKNPNRIYVGMKLRVPVDAEYKAEGN